MTVVKIKKQVAQFRKNDKRLQSNDSIETNVYGTSKDLVIKKEKIKCNNIIKQYKK